ncbi:MAG: phosphatase PAP2 family protein [Bacillota bacterium]
MTEVLYSVDLWIFYLVNHGLANPVFDKFFVFITDVNHWYIAYAILLGICFVKGGRTGKIAAVVSLLLVTFSDQLSSFFIKHWVSRIRPCNALSDVRALIDCSGSFSFPSSHAVNNFAVFAYFSRLYPKIKWILFIVAFLVSFSRIYVGRHYPSDVLGGALIGVITGYLFAWIVKWLDSFLQQKKIFQAGIEEK